MKILNSKFKLFIGMLIGIIIGSSITVYATGILAKDITYKKGNEEISVETALNELYSKKELDINVNEEVIYQYNDGNKNNQDIEISPELEGKYLLILTSIYVTSNTPILEVNKFSVDEKNIDYNISKITDHSGIINGESNTIVACIDLKLNSKIVINCNWIANPIVKIFKINN